MHVCSNLPMVCVWQRHTTHPTRSVIQGMKWRLLESTKVTSTEIKGSQCLIQWLGTDEFFRMYISFEGKDKNLGMWKLLFRLILPNKNLISTCAHFNSVFLGASIQWLRIYLRKGWHSHIGPLTWNWPTYETVGHEVPQKSGRHRSNWRNVACAYPTKFCAISIWTDRGMRWVIRAVAGPRAQPDLYG